MTDATDTTEDPDAVYAALGLPDALIKALSDHFDYAMGLRNGQIIRFEEAHLSSNGEWVHLSVTPDMHGDKTPMKGVEYPFDRGVDVRIDEIAWCADAPHGS